MRRGHLPGLSYRGVFMRRLGRSEAVAEANQAVFFNAHEAYRISHPAPGGDACLSLVVREDLLAELAPKDQLRDGAGVVFTRQRRRIDPQAQALTALLRHRLRGGPAELLQAETLVLSLVRRTLGERTSHASAGSYGREKLVDRAKLVLSSDLGRRWTLSDVAAEVGVSPVYLTQVFRAVEGVPLYRYQLRLRMAGALDRLGDCEDLTDLALDLGFSSHSHFSAAFRQTYGQTPAEFRRATRLR
jgi:AraC-like DNA-binding protein